MAPGSSTPSPFASRRTWLFPATYLVHIAEEFWAPLTFYVWASEFAGVRLTAQLFLVANTPSLALVILAVVLVAPARPPEEALLALNSTPSNNPPQL